MEKKRKLEEFEIEKKKIEEKSKEEFQKYKKNFEESAL